MEKEEKENRVILISQCHRHEVALLSGSFPGLLAALEEARARAVISLIDRVLAHGDEVDNTYEWQANIVEKLYQEQREAEVILAALTPLSKEVIESLSQEHYYDLKVTPGRGICGLRDFIFTTGLCYGLDETGYAGRYCYHTEKEAEDALHVWNGADNPTGNWIKHKTRNKDLHNPNYKRNDRTGTAC